MKDLLVTLMTKTPETLQPFTRGTIRTTRVGALLGRREAGTVQAGGPWT